MPTLRGCRRELVRLVCDAPLPEPLEDLALKGIPVGAAQGVPRGSGVQDASRADDGGGGASADRRRRSAMTSWRRWCRKPASRPAEPEKIEVDRSKYETVTDEAALDRWIAEATAQGFVAVDTETDCIDCIIAKLAGISLATAPNTRLLHPRRAQRR